MRDAFIKELNKIADADSRTLLLAGDIGYKVFDSFREAHKGRFINCGIAEANMVGMSAGLAMAGWKPYVYTIVPFLTMRAFEQIRVDLCMHDQSVVLVGVGGGLAYDVLGPTHHAIEDISIMRSLPRMCVLVPCDPEEVKHATSAAHNHKHPVYIRLAKNGERVLNTENSDQFKIGKARVLRTGSDVGIIGCGPILSVALDVADKLNEIGVSCSVLNMHTIKPIDKDAIIKLSETARTILTLEEHSIIGGLGSAVSEVLLEAGCRVRFKRFGIEDKFTTKIAKRDALLRENLLDADLIYTWIMSEHLPNKLNKPNK